MTPADVAARLAVSAALGFAVGLERQLGRHPEEGYAGARTFTLAGLLGGLAALVTSWSRPAGVALVALFAAILVTSYVLGAARTEDVGSTTELAAAVVFTLGFVVHEGMYTVAVAVSVGVVVLLRSKVVLYRVAERFSDEDVRTVLQFAVMSAVILPFVPDESFGPSGAFNPHEIWLMVVLVGAIGLAGYISLRLLGPRGLVPTGLLGGLVSSTAVALAFGRHARARPELARPLAAGVLGGSGLMYARVWVEARIVSPALATLLFVPMAGLFVLVEGAALLAARRSREAVLSPPFFEVRNPVSLRIALQFGALYGVVVAAGRLLVADGQASSLVALGAVSGVTDVDAITLTAANLVRGGVDPGTVVPAVLAAVGVNGAVKAGIAWFMGGSTFGRRVAPILGAASVVAAVAAFV